LQASGRTDVPSTALRDGAKLVFRLNQMGVMWCTFKEGKERSNLNKILMQIVKYSLIEHTGKIFCIIA
jgi:hypothetical protein